MGSLVPMHCFFGYQRPGGGAALDHLVIVHTVGSRGHDGFRVPKQVHIRPQGGSEKMEAVDFAGLIFKNFLLG